MGDGSDSRATSMIEALRWWGRRRLWLPDGTAVIASRQWWWGAWPRPPDVI